LACHIRRSDLFAWRRDRHVATAGCCRTGDHRHSRGDVQRHSGESPVLNVPTPVRVFLYTASTDMRKSFSGLHGLIVEALKQDPLSGDWFVFVNRRRDRIKIMLWERDGFVIYYKQLQSGTFAMPACDSQSLLLTSQQLALILVGVDLKQTRPRKRYGAPAEARCDEALRFS
jgi:transposase